MIQSHQVGAIGGRLASRSLVAIGAILLLGGGGAYMVWRSQITSTQPAQPEAPPVVKTVTALGYLEPGGQVIQLSAPNSGGGVNRVEQLLVKQGEAVQAGQVIAILDSRDRLQASLVEAQKQVSVARSNLAIVQAGAKQGEVNAQRAEIARLEAQRQGDIQAQAATVARLQAELQNAQVEAQRYQQLYQQGAVSASLRDSETLTLTTAQLSLEEAQVVLQRIQTTRSPELAAAVATLERIAEVRPVDVAAAQAQVEQAIAAVQQAQAQLDLATVRAPQAGMVLEIHTRPGELIADEGIIELGQTQQMIALLEVYETEIGKVELGQTVKLFADSFPDALTGKVVEIGVQVKRQNVVNSDTSANIDARIVEVRVELDPASVQKVAGLTNLQVTGEIQL
ncbi:efflux RND transporter periplasmic adaptor subunit [Leptothoe sp. PORK10 BA2]|uniref:efflux RND transporter periplasmic adaptor subunit n=1 Tax=Leptothoe sp. PORK10 BA2 TaxID=3110254 RepID=UPI002B207C38|nr:efflux RND transporter periplasmic adaptor subunit [Leptothoe sp. PORK10 BA2]MEA5464267.1 efflux RND transporter periplasmic adaptor subunit [Leptothoe sp. PORK10 BA2]